MARKFPGNIAPYNPMSLKDECTWCTGKNAGVLSSESYNSCVGLVLYSDDHKIGVVAHFAGGMGTVKNRPQARKDVLEILRDVCPISPGIWKAWVFGGQSLNEKNDIRGTVEGLTKPLINLIWETIRTNPYIPINLLKNRADFKEPEMQPTSYRGHFGVKLDLASGKVAWVEQNRTKSFVL